MTRLTFALLAMLLAGPAFVAADEPTPRPPNFLVIMADDLGAGELACYGNNKHETPQLDRLADEGMRFRTCWATPLCTPTRVLIMTGQYGFRTGYYNFLLRAYAPKRNSPQFDIGSKTTFADLLKPAGYATACAGKWQLTGELPTLVNDCGFDEYCIWAWMHKLPEGATHDGRWENKRQDKPARFWHPAIIQDGELLPTDEDDYGPDIYCDYLIDFMKRNREQPFVAYYPMALTHTPWEPTPVPGQPGKKTPRGLKSNVEYTDHIVGRLVKSLDETGLRENTIVIFTGDNGTEKNGKGTVTEMGARVPLMVSWPGKIPTGVVSDELADLSDITPTLLDFSGVAVPEGHVLDGKSLKPTLLDPQTPHREWIFSYLADKRMLRDKRWLLEGDGRFYDCGTSRRGTGYDDVTNSTDPEVQAARQRFAEILTKLPAPDPSLQ